MQVSIRIALGLLAGIWLASAAPLKLSIVVWPAAALLLVIFAGPSARRTTLIAAIIGAFSFCLAEGEHAKVENHYFDVLDQREAVMLEGVVDGIAEVWPGRQQLRLRTPRARIWLTIYSEGAARPEPLLPGQRLRVFARVKSPIGLRGLGTFDRRSQLMSRGADLLASASADDLSLLAGKSSLWRWPAEAHFWALDRIHAGSSRPEGRAIVTALTTGDRSRMSEPLREAVRATGIAHLLAVSGMHLAALVTLVFFLVLRAWSWTPWRQSVEPRAVAAAIALIAAVGFTAMTGARPSTCRALLVATLVLFGIIFDRRVRLLHALAWSASLLLVWRPQLLWDPGFQLSFAATTALALALEQLDTRLKFDSPARARRILRAIWTLGRASFWATFATYPICLYHFGEVSWIGLATNLVAVPLTTLLLLPAALGGLALSALWPAAGALLIELAILLAEALAAACYGVQSVLPLAVRAPLNAWELMCWVVCGLALLGRSRRLTRRRRVSITVIALSLLVLSRIFAGPQAASLRRELRVTFVEIGQGDAAVIEAPGGQVWLMDGGGLPFVGSTAGFDRQHIAETPARQALLPYLRHRRIDRIDLAIISHPHPDHYVGLQAVSRVMPIAELWSAHTPRATPGAYEHWLESLALRGTKVVRPQLGKARDSHGASLHVLWPRYAMHEEAAGTLATFDATYDSDPKAHATSDPILSVNDNSLVVRLDFAGRRLLFTGDIEAEAEELLVQQFPAELRADLVKVPHHGSPTSSTASFVAATAATLAVISCGRGNHFGFPDLDVEARWSQVARYLLRTDLVGSVTVRVSPAGHMEVSTVSDF